MKVALGVSGGIACQASQPRSCERLQDRGVDVTVLMTKGATQFVTPLTFRALSGNRVYVDIFEGQRSGGDFEGAFDHILLAQSTDLFLVAPATADCIAKLANGVADDFLTTFHLAVTAPIVVAPAMNTRMWQHASVQANLKTLAGRGVHIIDPEVGQMACKTYGPGRLAPVEQIVEYVMTILNRAGISKAAKCLPPARQSRISIRLIISNRSSGKMGYAIAHVRNRGAQVVLESGPANLNFQTPSGFAPRKKCGAPFSIICDVDVVISGCPARLPAEVGRPQKSKKRGSGLISRPRQTSHGTGGRKNGTVLVGFAAETEDHVKHGSKNSNPRIWTSSSSNSANGPDSAFDSDMNHATIIDKSGNTEEIPLVSKAVLADKILDRVVQLLT
jgi:phosphopantothenoylcysteine decarboxylase/phosphopantothenate--cysteine ligase